MKKSLPLAFIAILFSAVFFIFSCKKKPDAAPGATNPVINNVLDKCDLKYILNASNNYVWKYIFDVTNPRKLVRAINLDQYGDTAKAYVILYNAGDKVVALQEWTGSFHFLQYVDSFTYNAGGQFDLEKVYSPDSHDSLELVQYYKYFYDANGTINRNESYSPANTLLASKEYSYDINDEVRDVVYYDASHVETASEHYHRTTFLYGHFDIFENILHRSAWQHAPDTIALSYGSSHTVSPYTFKVDNANYVVEADEPYTINGVTDTAKFQTFQYQCFK